MGHDATQHFERASGLLADSEGDPAWAATLGEGTDVRTATVDSEGLLLEPGPDLQPTLIGDVVAAPEACLG